jgi:hypothetical protein
MSISIDKKPEMADINMGYYIQFVYDNNLFKTLTYIQRKNLMVYFREFEPGNNYYLRLNSAYPNWYSSVNL